MLYQLGRIWQFRLFDIGEHPLTLGAVIVAIVGLVILWRAAGALRTRVLLQLLRHTALAEGTQFAVARIGYYLILALGLLVILDNLGLSLSSLTLIGGLIGVGVGFGMQNVTSNFVSGIILLVERPVSVGDVVTVGGTEGVIQAISMRVTKIRSLDNITLYVPNSKLIDDVVTNWSAEDPKIRLHVTVGVAYGSDVDKVVRLLLDVAKAHPKVMATPKPEVWFTAFGDSSLDFDLLVWVAEPADRFRTPSELRVAITDVFRENDIEIPFPQHDLYLRSAVPLRMATGEETAEGS